MKYRIKHIAGLGHFAQVCVQEETVLPRSGFGNSERILEVWKTIGDGPNPSLLEESYTVGPLNWYEVRERIANYIELKDRESQHVTYTPYKG